MAAIVEKGKFGVSVRYGDIVELAEVMQEMLGCDSLPRVMGRRGPKFVAQEFDLEKVVSKIEGLYEEAQNIDFV